MTLPYIMVAPNGARLQKHNHPALPIAIEEIVETAINCFAAGANGIHAHVRDVNAQHVLDAALYNELIAELKIQVPSMDVQITTEAVGAYNSLQQIELVRQVQPKMVSLALSELTSHGDKQELTAFYHTLVDNAVGAQHILYDPAEIEQFSGLVDEGVIPDVPPSFLFVLGRYAKRQQSTPADFDAFSEALDASVFAQSSKVMTCAFGRSETECLLHVATNGSDCRIGFENNIMMRNGRIAQNNAERVNELRKLLLAVDKPESTT